HILMQLLIFFGIFFCIFLIFFCFIFFFFFQAEDGIRDRNVTGVQTCALPISVSVGVVQYLLKPFTFATLREKLERYAEFRDASRSEERRVGKECRSRWSPDH